MRRIRRAVVVAMVLALAVGLKWHYSRAGADELLYVLWPTTKLVEAMTGADFVHEGGAGFLSRELAILIAPSCAGVNFLAMAWCISATRASPAWLPVCAVLSWAATVVVNATRIVSAATLPRIAVLREWLAPDELHRLLGILIYLPALMLLYAAVTAAQKRWAT